MQRKVVNHRNCEDVSFYPYLLHFEESLRLNILLKYEEQNRK